MVSDWFSIWYEPDPEEHVAFLDQDAVARIGGATPLSSPLEMVDLTNQGNAILARWCRQHCREPGTPVNVRGQTGWAFRHLDDALMFKLTWGGA